MTAEEKKEIDFEKALEQLEQIVSKMESNQLPLAEMMKNYEKGKKLSAFCTKKLQDFEKKIEILIDQKAKDGEWKEYN